MEQRHLKVGYRQDIMETSALPSFCYSRWFTYRSWGSWSPFQLDVETWYCILNSQRSHLYTLSCATTEATWWPRTSWTRRWMSSRVSLETSPARVGPDAQTSPCWWLTTTTPPTRCLFSSLVGSYFIFYHFIKPKNIFFFLGIQMRHCIIYLSLTCTFIPVHAVVCY